MRKTFKYRLYPNKETEQKLYWTLTRCRELYNAALSERKDAYKYAGKSISYYDQQNDLPEIKSEIREEYQDIAAHVLQDVFEFANTGFQTVLLLAGSLVFGIFAQIPQFAGAANTVSQRPTMGY